MKQSEQQGNANQNMKLGYKSKSGKMFGLYPRFYWDVSDVPFGGIPNIKQDSIGFRAGTTVERSKSKQGGRFSTIKREKEFEEVEVAEGQNNGNAMLDF